MELDPEAAVEVLVKAVLDTHQDGNLVSLFGVTLEQGETLFTVERPLGEELARRLHKGTHPVLKVRASVLF